MKRPGRRLRVVFGEERGVVADHAKSLLKALAKSEMQFPSRAKPRGIAHHTAHFPILCDDCGQTFWSRDEFGSHLGCKGAPKSFGAGFQS